MVVLDISYTYIKVQVSIIGLMLPKKRFPMTLIPWMGSRKGKGWGYTFASMPINKQQLIIVSIKATILNTIKDEQIIYQTFNVHPMTKQVCIMFDFFVFLFLLSDEKSIAQ